MPFLGLSKPQANALSLEVVSERARLKLTRLIRASSDRREAAVRLACQNHYINIANTAMGRPIYHLESDDWGDYQSAEYAWHAGQLELIMRRPTTAQLVEILADYIQNRMLDDGHVNAILEEDGCGFKVQLRSFAEDDEAFVALEDLNEIEAEGLDDDHPNIRALAQRMDAAIEQKDAPAVLHASASIFETLAKDVIGDQDLENQTLGSFFEKYRKTSSLPPKILDFILDTYKARNTTPLAGHGGTKPPSIKMPEAIALCEMTKAFVRMERQLRFVEIDTKTPDSPKTGKGANKAKGPSKKSSSKSKA